MLRIRVHPFLRPDFFRQAITMRKVGGNLMIIAGIIICLNR